MRARLVSYNIGDKAYIDHSVECLGRICEKADRQGLLSLCRVFADPNGLLDICGHNIQITGCKTSLNPAPIHFDADHDTLVHGDREWLRASHASEAAANDNFSPERGVPVFLSKSGKGFVGPLEDTLRPDVDPGPCGHLTIHHETFLLQLVKVIPVGPAGHQIRVGDQNTRCPAMSA